MLYYKTRDSKIPLDTIASADGGGNGLVNDLKVDKNYQPKSPNAQAGTAVAEAVKGVEDTINTKYGEVMRYKGSVASYNSLPSSKAKGDVYNVQDTNANYAWNGSTWDKLNENLDGYVKNTTFSSLQTAFNDHTQNKNTNVKHLTDTLLSKLQSLEVFTQAQLTKQITDAITSSFTSQGIITDTQLQQKLNALQTTIQNTVVNNITNSFSATYTSKADFDSYKADQTKALEMFIKCDEADNLKIYTPAQTPTATPLISRETRTLYILGGMTA